VVERPDPDTSLLAVRYEPRAGDLWRWVDGAQDEAVARFAAGFAALDAPDRERLRSQLGEAESEVLLTYAQRCALAAVRTRDVRPVLSAFDALSAITLDAATDDRDVAMVAMLVTYAGQSLGHDMSRAAAAAVARAEPETAELLTDVLAERVDLIQDCGYREVDSPAGRVFVEDEGASFDPRSDLLGTAYAVAEAVEADRYQVDSIGVGQELTSVWLGTENPDAVQAATRLTGCAEVDSRLRDVERWHALTVYLAEAPDDAAAASIAAAAEGAGDSRTPQIGVAVGRLCAVLHASTPNLDDHPVEDATSVLRFRPVLTAALTDRAG
jgi:hypothetical protein